MRLADDYAAGREAFCRLAAGAGGAVTSLPHPLTGPGGEALATDVAVFGAADAPTRMAVFSGTHGIEGFAGNLCQTEWLRVGITPPPGTAIVLIHAVNPYGFAWQRRVNEDNVDLNRNFVDFSEPRPENPGYDELAAVLVPQAWDEATRAATAETLLAYGTEHGFETLQAAVSVGQYRHPDGVFYGGAEPVWSHRMVRDVVATHLAGAARVVILDLHTGLGPFGHGELIIGHPDPAGQALLDRCFEDYRDPAAGTSVSADVRGDMLDGIAGWLPGVPVAGVAIEWGTVDIIAVSEALRADAWLHAHDDPRGPHAAEIKAQIRAAFAPDDPRWPGLVWDRFVEVRDRAFAGLAG